MSNFVKSIEVRWSDLDPNFHLRHSVYYDWGAYSRFCFFSENGLTSDVLLQNNIGPILFREECSFRREIKFGDHITIDLQLLKARPDQSRWSIQHHIYKNSDTLSAIITVDGAWIDTVKRKLAVPPESISNALKTMPQSESFEWIK